MSEETGICAQPTVKQSDGILLRIWTWCSNRKLLVFLLFIIAMQQALLVLVSVQMLRDGERANKDRITRERAIVDLLKEIHELEVKNAIHTRQRATTDLAKENRELKAKIKMMEHEAQRGK